MSTLVAEHLEKHYKARAVVKDFSISIKNGEIVGLLGPNGAGKTTSFYMIVGLVQCDAGKVMLDGQEITRAPVHIRARAGIGYLPQESSIFRKLTVAQNILAILSLRKNLSKNKRQEILESLMQEFHVAHLRDSMAYTLSGGERRRVEIARALAIDPQFILLDEPFAGIDPISVIDIKRIILHLRDRGIGVLVTDHNVRETLAICERAYIVNEGKIMAEGTPESILSNQQVREVYLGHEFDL
ncbi:MAG: lptB [Gammaproteobacteria bacterium]|jgi:lipopolysaccharide export system ATP-binding protein|nr:lptB [Gammaproteobacteria bacterium]